MDLASDIRKKALEFGFTKCGIINVDAVEGFKEKLDQRVAAFPMSSLMYNRFRHFTDVRRSFPWAESLVVCVHDYAKYEVPESLKGRVGRAYMFDGRRDKNSEVYRAKEELTGYLKGLGMQVAREDDYGITSLRFAAEKAGLGRVRKNNFFYTENGSWNSIDVFAVDAKLELIDDDKTKECPDDCNNCMKACPTGSLTGPYTMQPMSCVSFITSKSGGLVELAGNPLSEKIGNWVFGCDECQKACPFDRRPEGKEKFPGLDAIADELSLENIVDMSDEFFNDVLQPKFWYIEQGMQWMWKVNALNAMKNDYKEEYAPYIRKCVDDPNERISRMARWVCETLHI